MDSPTDIAIIGAGPYGMSAAAHLRAAGLEPVVFGRPMDFWSRNMPVGMLLRSSKNASSISDPARELTIERYEAAAGKTIPRTVPVEDFIAYGLWFASQAVPAIDSRRVLRVEADGSRFRLLLDDDTSLSTRRVVVAAGIAPFALYPPQFADLPAQLVSHSADHHELDRFRDKRVVVIGAGQSALETAALLHEAGSEVEVVARDRTVIWIRGMREESAWRKALHQLLYAPTEVGPPGACWIPAAPDVFRRVPGPIQRQLSEVSLRPMGSGWLRPRLADVPISTGLTVTSASAHGDHVRLTLDDGSVRELDHVVLGTGFRTDIARYGFFAEELLRSCATIDGEPILGDGLESSIPGLHFIGATSVMSFGPVMRFVSGTPFTSRALTRRVLGAAPAPLSFSW